jgi:hypothetical protein
VDSGQKTEDRTQKTDGQNVASDEVIASGCAFLDAILMVLSEIPVQKARRKGGPFFCY